MRPFSFLLLLALAIGSFTAPSFGTISSSVGSYPTKVPFMQVVYVCGTTVGTGDKSGKNPADCLPFADQDLWRIPANTLITKVWAVIDTLITGTTAMTIGDDDGATSFIPDAAFTLGTAGMYGWNPKSGGAYLRVETAGGTDALDIDVVPNAKYYAASGKEVKMDITTANTAGVMRIIIEGVFLGANSKTF